MVFPSAACCLLIDRLKLTLHTLDRMFALPVIISALVLVSHQQTLAQSCSGFNVTTDYSDSTYTSISNRGFIISKGVVCPATQNCSLDIGGWVTDGRTLNISDQASAKSIYDTISKVIDLPFNETQTYEVATNYGHIPLPMAPMLMSLSLPTLYALREYSLAAKAMILKVGLWRLAHWMVSSMVMDLMARSVR